MNLTVSPLMEYDADLAEQMGVLLKDLSSHYEGEAVPREVIEDIIESPWYHYHIASYLVEFYYQKRLIIR